MLAIQNLKTIGIHIRLKRNMEVVDMFLVEINKCKPKTPRMERFSENYMYLFAKRSCSNDFIRGFSLVARGGKYMLTVLII